MAYRRGQLSDLLQLASTSRLRSAVTLAAVSFAVCHLVSMATGPGSAGGSADLDIEIPRQLIHLAAELCRFALPLGFMVAGLAIPAKTRPPGKPKQ
jgi:hypothetical protein